MNLYEIIGRIVAWLFVGIAGLFVILIIVALVLSTIDEIRERRHNERR